jgi:hypothetical protein
MRTTIRPCTRALILLACALLYGGPLPAQTASTDAAAPPMSTDSAKAAAANVPSYVANLGDHYFMNAIQLPDPFVRTVMQPSLGIGISPAMTLEPLELQGQQLFVSKVQLTYAVMSVTYQQKLRDWLAMHLQLGFVGRSSSSSTAMLSQGMTFTTLFELGWLFHVLRSRSMLLSSYADVRSMDLTTVSLKRYLSGIADSIPVPASGELMQTVPIVRTAIGFNALYALSNRFGLRVNLEGAYGESFNRLSAEEWTYQLGFALDYNLRLTSDSPVGFLLGYQYSTLPLAGMFDSPNSQSVFGRIGYVGTQGFEFGLDLQYLLYPNPKLGQDVGFMSGGLDFALFFQ